MKSIMDVYSEIKTFIKDRDHHSIGKTMQTYHTTSDCRDFYMDLLDKGYVKTAQIYLPTSDYMHLLDEDKKSLLMMAVASKDRSTFRSVLFAFNDEAKLNGTDVFGSTALMMAATLGDDAKDAEVSALMVEDLLTHAVGHKIPLHGVLDTIKAVAQKGSAYLNTLEKLIRYERERIALRKNAGLPFKEDHKRLKSVLDTCVKDSKLDNYLKNYLERIINELQAEERSERAIVRTQFYWSINWRPTEHQTAGKDLPPAGGYPFVSAHTTVVAVAGVGKETSAHSTSTPLPDFDSLFSSSSTVDLMSTIITEDLKAFEKELKKAMSEDLNVKNASGDSLLMTAAALGQVTMVQGLLLRALMLGCSIDGINEALLSTTTLKDSEKGTAIIAALINYCSLKIRLDNKDIEACSGKVKAAIEMVRACQMILKSIDACVESVDATSASSIAIGNYLIEVGTGLDNYIESFMKGFMADASLSNEERASFLKAMVLDDKRTSAPAATATATVVEKAINAGAGASKNPDSMELETEALAYIPTRGTVSTTSTLASMLKEKKGTLLTSTASASTASPAFFVAGGTAKSKEDEKRYYTRSSSRKK